MNFPPHAKKNICMVIGTDVSGSLSPRMHTFAYKYLKIDGDFFYVSRNISETEISDFIAAVRLLDIRGVSITAPHKSTFMKYMDNIDPDAERIGAINTIVNANGVLRGHNTDWLGIIGPLEKVCSLQNKSVAIVGAGGAAQAALYGLRRKGAHVTLFNRTKVRAQRVAKQSGTPHFGLESLSQINQCDIVINTLPKISNIASQPAEKVGSYLQKNQILFDITYGPKQTKLPTIAKSKGALVVDGLEMLVYQGQRQFKLFTGQNVSLDILRKSLQFNVREK